jgi:CubicO group peptidase (beta-lactamase class C family)
MILKLLPALVLATTLAHAADYFPQPDSKGGWREAKDAKTMREHAGMDLSQLEPAYTMTERSTAHGGLLVVRNGWLVYERYFGRASRDVNPDMASTGKAFCSIACGIMLDEFKAKIPEGLDTKVFTETYLPQAIPFNDPRKANITLGQLLCMTAGYWGEGQAPTGYVKGDPKPKPLKAVPGQNIKDLDASSLNVPLWTDPGAGYSYSSPSPHIASIVLRNVTGMELKDYINERLAKPQGWGAWDYCLHRGDFVMPHANGAGSTALHATDVMRFGYCLARNGKWQDQQLVPSDYIKKCQNPDGGISYSLGSRGASRPAISAAGVAVLYNAGMYDDQPFVDKAIQYVKKNINPTTDSTGHHFYTQLYYAQALYQRGGKDWDDYLAKIGPWLVRTQKKDGSWDGDGVGPIYGTAIALTILQLPFALVPIYQR